MTECIALCEKYGKQCSAQGRSREYLEQFRDVKCVSHYHIKAPEIVLYTGYKKLLESLR